MRICYDVLTVDNVLGGLTRKFYENRVHLQIPIIVFLFIRA